MNKIINWSTRNFFFIAIGIFMIIYLRWFQLTPLEFGYYNDPNGAYIFGLKLLGIYFSFLMLTRIVKNHRLLKNLFSIVTFLFLGINIIHVFFFLPRITTTTKCNGKLYFITDNSGTLGYFKSYDQLTIWKGLQYESHFFGYSQGPYEIICDEAQGNANIIRTINGVLTYSHGESSQSFYDYAGAEFENHQYFLAFTCNNWHDYTCPSETYTLYECNLDYKSCASLHISYTSDNVDYLVLEANQETGEINLYDDYEDNPDRTLIFTYSEHPRCYVEGCEILDESK